MSPEQIGRVRTTVSNLVGREDQLAAAFANGLAVHAPTALRLIPDPAGAGGAVLSQLQSFARVVADFPELEAWARRLGAATGSPVTATELVGMGTSLVEALETVFGSALSADDRDAWRAGVTLVCELVR